MGIEDFDDDLPLSDEQRADLDRRIADDEVDTQPAEDWESLRLKLLSGDF